MTKSFADVIASEKNGRQRATRLVCFHPTMSTEYRELGAQLVLAAKRKEQSDPDKPTTRRLAQGDEADRLLSKIDTMITENPDAFYEVHYQQLRGDQWRKIKSAHAPRDKVSADRGLYNTDTFPRAAVKASLIDPDPTDETMDFLDDVLSEGEWKGLASAIWEINEGVRSVPKDRAALSEILDSFTTM